MYMFTFLKSGIYTLPLLFILPTFAQAGDSATDLAFDFVNTFNDVILFPTIGLLSAIALLVFIFGAFQNVVQANDPAARSQGIKHITWGIVGLVVMLSAYTIMLLFANTFGLGDELNCANNPGANGCDGVVIPAGTFNTNNGQSAGNNNNNSGQSAGNNNTNSGQSVGNNNDNGR